MRHTLNKGETPSFSSKTTLVLNILLSLVQASETPDLDEL